MSTPLPSLGIVVPSFNHGRFLARTLDSIFAQSPPAQEVWVIDGASTDDTTEILRGYAARHPSLHWISERDSGPAEAVNKGLARAQSQILGIQSADDVYRPGAFAAVLDAFRADARLGFVYGDADVIDGVDRVVMQPRLPPFSLESLFCIRLSVPQSSAFFRRELARELGGWNGEYFGCDVDFWMRMAFRAPARKLDRVLSGWRQHPGQRTAPNRRAWEDYWRMIDRAPELQHAAPPVRRAARASRHILALYLHPTGSAWALRWHTLCALITYPAFVRHVPQHRFYPLVPGYPALRRIRRWLLARSPA